MSANTHPDDETLGRFALGQLDRKTMARVEGHLWGCSRCGQVVRQAPEDRLVTLLKASTPGFTSESPADDTTGLSRSQAQGPVLTSSTGRSPGRLGTLVLLTCLACVLAFAASGCSRGEDDAPLSPEAQARARAVLRTKFQDFGEKKDHRFSR